MRSLCLYVAALLLCVTSAMTSDCKPRVNCKMPGCRCWDDPDPPGGIDGTNAPQMVLVSFEKMINGDNVNNYTSLFDGLKNPNNCSARGTFFVQILYSSAETLRQVHKDGHEIGVTSSGGKVPVKWRISFKVVKDFLVSSVWIPSTEVLGARVPDLYFGGDPELDAMSLNGLTYDTTCVTKQYTTRESMLWPYTYDFVNSTPECVTGNNTATSHPGMWQFIRPELDFKNDMKCATLSACSPYLKNATDTYYFLFRNFASHYYAKRTPFILEVTADWLAVPHQAIATRNFLSTVANGPRDAWIITHSQALAWLKHPVTADKVKDFAPWGC